MNRPLAFARRSRHLEQSVAFYRDLVGLPVREVFRASYGTDGSGASVGVLTLVNEWRSDGL